MYQWEHFYENEFIFNHSNDQNVLNDLLIVQKSLNHSELKFEVFNSKINCDTQLIKVSY